MESALDIEYTQEYSDNYLDHKALAIQVKYDSLLLY